MKTLLEAFAEAAQERGLIVEIIDDKSIKIIAHQEGSTIKNIE